MAAASSAVASSSVVFAETQNVAPARTPARTARAPVNGRPSAAATVHVHSSIHRSSVRNCVEVSKNTGVAPASRAAQTPACEDHTLRPMRQVAYSVPKYSGIIASRAHRTTSARSPSNISSGAHSRWNSGVWLSNTSR